MHRVVVDLKKHQGKEIFIRLVDHHSGHWGHVNFDAMGEAHRIDFRHYFATEFAALGPMVAHGLVRLSDHDLVVTEQGWFLVRAVAMVFDRYCRATRTRFSRVV